MSSLIGTSNQEDVPVSGVQTISGLKLNITGLPSRSCNGFSFVDLTKGKPDTTRAQAATQQQGMSSSSVFAASATTSSSTVTATKNIGGDGVAEAKTPEGLKEFMSILAGKKTRQTLPPTPPSAKQTQQHDKCFNIPQPPSLASASKGHATTSSITPLAAGNITFDFTFGSSNGKSIAPSNQSLPTVPLSDDKFAVASNFQFSFSPPPSLNVLSPATTRGGMGYQRRMGNGRSLQQQQHTRRRDTQGMHPLSQTTTLFEDIDQDDGESDSDPPLSSSSLLPSQEPSFVPRRHDTIPTSEISKYPHLQHRKILPLPKPRWKRQGLSKPPSAPPPPPPPPFSFSFASQKPRLAYLNQSTTPGIDGNNDSLLAPPSFTWQSSAPSRDNADEDWGFGQLSLTEAEQETLYEIITGESGDSSYRDNAKKMKRSVGNETDAPVVMMTIGSDYDARKGVRRRDRKWKTRNSASRRAEERGSRTTISTGGGPSKFPSGSFDFSEDSRTHERLKHLPKLEDLPRSNTTLGLSKVLRQTLPNIPPPPLAASRDSNGRAEPLSGQGSIASKKKNRAMEAIETTSRPASDKPAVATSVSKRTNKKGQRKKKMDDDHGTTNKGTTSDVSLIQSPDPDEWICLFCQYEIFCRGLEAARRKGGYYRRRKERQRRLKEAEARRAGELAGSDHEIEPSLDDMMPTSSVAAGPPPPPPPPPAAAPLAIGEIVDQRRARGDRAA